MLSDQIKKVLGAGPDTPFPCRATSSIASRLNIILGFFEISSFTGMKFVPEDESISMFPK